MNTYLKGSEKWLGNFVLDDGIFEGFNKLSPPALAMIAKTIQGVQQFRSSQLAQVMKLDIWDIKHMFKHKFKQFISENNFSSSTMD